MNVYERMVQRIVNGNAKEAYRPLFFDANEKEEEQALQKLLEEDSRLKIVDTFEDQLEELFLIRNPEMKLQYDHGRIRYFLDKRLQEKPFWRQGKWVYFPWIRILTHILDREEFYELRTARNRNLITEEEQESLRKFPIGIVGLSVGNSVACALALEGFEYFQIADYDALSLSNTNRVRAGAPYLGESKAVVAAHQIFELNPYAEVTVFEEGLGKNNAKEFFKKLGLVVDEVDDVETKVYMRSHAKKLGIPLISAADNGDGAIVDVERYDRGIEYPLFHGDADRYLGKDLSTLSFAEKMDLICSIVGAPYVTKRMNDSFLEVGKTIYSWPQLGGAAMLSGAILAFVIRNIILEGKIESGKYNISPECIFFKPQDR